MDLVTLTKPQSAAAEAYRTLRTNLYFATLGKPAKTIVVASSSADEDAATALANLAVVLAQADKSVIAVEANLRNPSLCKTLGVDGSGAGFADMLSDERLTGQPPIKQTQVPGLMALAAGAPPAHPSDLFSSARLAGVIAALEKKADVVLLSAPPLGSVSDAALLASRCDGAILVVTAGKTRREAASGAKELLERAKARALGVVMLN